MAWFTRGANLTLSVFGFLALLMGIAGYCTHCSVRAWVAANEHEKQVCRARLESVLCHRGMDKIEVLAATRLGEYDWNLSGVCNDRQGARTRFVAGYMVNVAENDEAWRLAELTIDGSNVLK
jgi:hypothetical protein